MSIFNKINQELLYNNQKLSTRNHKSKCEEDISNTFNHKPTSMVKFNG